MQDVEAEVIMRTETAALRKALTQLDPESYRLILALYLTDERKTEREIAREYGVSQVAIHKQKKESVECSEIFGYQNSKKFPIESERTK